MPSFSTASLCENPAVLRAQLRISGFTLGMETFWHAKGGWREFFLSTLRIRRLPTRRFGHRGYAATREAAMAAFGSRGGASGPLADFDLEALAPVCPKNEGAYYPILRLQNCWPSITLPKREKFEKTFLPSTGAKSIMKSKTVSRPCVRPRLRST
jgi:hypothetical protein